MSDKLSAELASKVQEGNVGLISQLNPGLTSRLVQVRT